MTTTKQTLRAYNDQAVIECCGYAVDDDVLIMLDAVGYKTSCKSIWATTVNSPRKAYTITPRVTVTGGDVRKTKYRAFWMELPEQNAHNMVVCHTRLLDASPVPGEILPFYLVTGAADDEIRQRMHDRRFVALLNQALDLPILPEWSGWLWVSGLESQLITQIKHGGDVSGAWRVQTHAAQWAEIVQIGLAQQKICLL